MRIEDRDILFFAVIDKIMHGTKLLAAHKHGILFQELVFDLANSAIATHKRLGF